jgi:hypothetical protein
VRHVVRNYIASEDIKSARDVIGYRIEVVQLWTPEVQRLANARWRLVRWAPASSRDPSGHDRFGRCVEAPPEDAGGLSDRAECNPKIADMVKLLEGMAAPAVMGKSGSRATATA